MRRMTTRLPDDLADAIDADADARGLSVNRWLEHAARHLLATQPASAVTHQLHPPAGGTAPMTRDGAIGTPGGPITKG